MGNTPSSPTCATSTIDNVDSWRWNARGHGSSLGIHRFTGEEAMDYCEHWAEKPAGPSLDKYWVPHRGFELTCDLFPEDLTIPVRILGEEPPCVSYSTTERNDGDKTLTPVVKFCNLDVCSDLTIIGARKQCHDMLPRCFGVCDNGNQNMALDYTSAYKFWRAPAGYMHQIMNRTQSSVGNESTITTGPKCFGKDITDGKMPEDKAPIEGKTWVQLIKDRLPKGVYWTERPAQ